MPKLFLKAILTPYDPEHPFRSFVYKIVRIFVFSLKVFHRRELYLKASLLTFYSLISIVPILTIILAIGKGFGFDEFLQTQLLETFKEQQDIFSTAFRFSSAIIGHIKTQAIVGIGVLFLFFSVFGLFENIEKTLNLIWNVQKPRHVIRRVINYMMALIFFPILLITSTSMTIFLNSEITKTAQNYEFLTGISHMVLFFLKLAPYGLMCALFSYVYLVTPNTAVAFRPRIFAGILAGVIFQFWQIVYINLQVTLSSYSVIYGGFAALPLFLIWMQINFVIFLFGAAIAAQIEGDRFFKKTKREDSFKIVDQKQLCLAVLHSIISYFLKGEKPLSINNISKELGVSLLDAREILNILEKAGLIAQIGLSERYQLIINPELFTLQSLCDILDTFLLKKVLVKETPSLHAVSQYFAQVEESFKDYKNTLNLKAFVDPSNKDE